MVEVPPSSAGLCSGSGGCKDAIVDVAVPIRAHFLQAKVGGRRWRDEGRVCGDGTLLLGPMGLVLDRGPSVGEGVGLGGVLVIA